MKTALEKLFGFDSAKHSVRTEIMAGITSFLTMTYILAVNPSIFSALPDMPGGSVFTATVLASIVGTLVMALYAKKPFGLAALLIDAGKGSLLAMSFDSGGVTTGPITVPFIMALGRYRPYRGRPQCQ